MVLLLYADDILLTGSDETLLLPLVESLGKRFPMKDLGQPSYFLGIELQSTEGECFFISQHMSRRYFILRQ